MLDEAASPTYQESYDNAGLITGDSAIECTGILCTLDSTEEVIFEAQRKNCNLVIAHHPIVFSGLKKITGKNYVEKAIICAIKNDIAIYAIHTNLDNIITGVNGKIAEKLQLQKTQVLVPKQNTLMKLFTFVPVANAEKVKAAIFNAGAGNIGNYSEVSFSVNGTSTFTPGEGSNPFLGELYKKEISPEEKIEAIFPAYLQSKIVSALIEAHPYEEVAYDLVPLSNQFSKVGSGLIGELPEEISEADFLQKIKTEFNLQVIRHTLLVGKNVKKVAVCGGAGSFLIKNALAAGADFYITADVKYHEFFDAENKMVIADIGHWESEQFTTDLLYDILRKNFPTFAILKSGVVTNPVQYFT